MACTLELFFKKQDNTPVCVCRLKAEVTLHIPQLVPMGTDIDPLHPTTTSALGPKISWRREKWQSLIITPEAESLKEKGMWPFYSRDVKGKECKDTNGRRGALIQDHQSVFWEHIWKQNPAAHFPEFSFKQARSYDAPR